MSEKPGGDDLNAVLKQMESVSIEAAQNGSILSFAGKSLKLDKEEDAKVITDAMDKVKNLISLNLEGNTLGVNASKAIADALAKHKHFKRALWKDMFTGRMKTEIPDALRFLGNGLQQAGARLTELDLSDNAFGPIGVEGLADLLRSSCCFALEELKLNNNGLGITGGKLLAKALLDCYERSKQDGGKPLALKLFIAGRNRLENEGAKALANVFKTLKSLEEVQMPQNGIYHVGIAALSDAFKENKNLTHLNLNDNTITHKGAVPLGSALASLNALKVLNLGDCLLKSAGAICIAQSLQNSQQLEDVNFSCNEIALDGGLALTRAAQNKARLKRINLSENQFGEEGVEQIVQLMKSFKQNDALLLEDDEGICSDEEENEEDNEVESEEDGSDAENDDSNVASTPTSPSSETRGDRSKQPSVGDFLNAPSYAVFESLGPNCVQMFLDEINSEPEDRYLESMLLSIMKVSSVLSSDVPSVNDDKVFDCVKALYNELFTWASSSADKLCMVTNSLLVYLGLIKCEDKTFKISYNVNGCMFAIRRLCADKMLPAQTESQLWACIKLKEEKGSRGTVGVPVIDCY